jgi:type IV pilus assembly protein PilN
MIRINLLPWREAKRKRQLKSFYIWAAIFAGVGLAIGFAVHTYLNDQIDDRVDRNAYLDKEIKKLDEKLAQIDQLKSKIDELLQRKKVVEALQANRAGAVQLLDQLVRQMPDGVYLKGVAQKGDRIVVSGFAQSNARVSTFMRNLESSSYLEKPNLIEIKAVTDKTSRINEFSLAVFLTRAKEEPAGKKPASKTATTAAIPASQVVTPSTPNQGKK